MKNVGEMSKPFVKGQLVRVVDWDHGTGRVEHLGIQGDSALVRGKWSNKKGHWKAWFKLADLRHASAVDRLAELL